MANLGQNPELEEKLFCDDCRGGAHGQVIVYDEPEILRLMEAKEIKHEGRCVRCGIVREQPKSERKSESESHRRHA